MSLLGIVGLAGQAQPLISEDAPYISLWTETNVSVAQPSIQCLALIPQADYFALKDDSTRQVVGQ